MPSSRPNTARLLLAGACLAATSCLLERPAAAQDYQEEGVSPVAAGDPVDTSRGVYEPSYFERFAPRTALDMLNRLPGFDVQQRRPGESGDRQAQQRGFGQASENILINGERLSSKADSVANQLARIAASNVVRIEIVDGATLDLPGLSGQVANIVVERTGGWSGQFSWSPEYRTAFDRLALVKGKASVTGSFSNFKVTLAADATPARFQADGPTFLTSASGEFLELRETDFVFDNDRTNYTASVNYSGARGFDANLNLSYTPTDFRTDELDFRTITLGPDSSRDRVFEGGREEYEIGGDIEFDLGPGRLKLIGVNSSLQRDVAETAIFTFEGDPIPSGTRFAFDRKSTEKIARAEYSWPMAGLDLQWSGEAAFNTLDNLGELFVLDDAGQFIEIPFPGGTGGVSEDRYETILSASGSLAPTLTFQLGGGAEFSTLSQTGVGDVSRSFTRPKGSLSLAWNPGDGWNVAFELARRVGQLDFGDFLATVSLADETENASNAELVPQQSWESEMEIRRDLGRWGNATLTVFHERIEDLVDFIATPSGAAARGNISSARRSGAELDATIELANLGWRGARLDIKGRLEHSRLNDPVDGSRRPISSGQPHRLAVDLRHDIPQTDLAWGTGFSTTRTGRYFRVSELGRDYSGPNYLSVFGEHKDVLGLTVRAEVVGVFDPPERRLIRTIFDGIRGRDTIDFFEDRQQRIGRLVILTISGNF